MKQIRFIMQGCGQTGVDTYKDYYRTEVVEVSDRAYELLTSRPLTQSTNGEVFMCAEELNPALQHGG